MRRLTAIALVSLAMVARVAADSPQSLESAGVVDAVTVYRGQALVSRVVELSGPVGLREVVVTGLPEFLIPASLYAESGDGLEVRSVSYRVRPLPEDARENVRKLEASIRDVRDQIAAAASRKSFMEWQRQYLDKLENFLSATAQVESGKGVLNAETIASMTDLIASRRRQQAEDGHALALEVRGYEEQLVLLQRELEGTAARSSRTAREAIVFLNQTKPGSSLRLNYLVERANWSPSYNLRYDASAAGDQVVVEYQASVQQMSGEDWSNVAITISTATPALVASSPTLDPLTVALAAPEVQQAGELAQWKDRGYVETKKALAMKQRDAEDLRNFTGNVPAQQVQMDGDQAGRAQTFNPAAVNFISPEADKGLNDAAALGQLLDVVISGNVDNREGRGKAISVAADESVSVTYAIPTRTSLPSRADEQLLQIARITAPAAFSKVATPLLTSYVYDQATVTNAGSQVLLAGPSASYRNGEFVGRGAVPTVAAGESFDAGFGIDTSLRASRELLERTESIQGGNRVVEFAYRLSVENFAKSPASIRLLDRVPNPRAKDIKLTLVPGGAKDPQLSTDPTYERTDKKNGILRWDVTVPAASTGTDAFGLEYRFRLEYDKQMSITEGRAG